MAFWPIPPRERIQLPELVEDMATDGDGLEIFDDGLEGCSFSGTEAVVSPFAIKLGIHKGKEDMLYEIMRQTRRGQHLICRTMKSFIESCVIHLWDARSIGFILSVKASELI
ncbi:hypothetical protein TIFTF001_032022 [Ficus carica]|uniref:Uncharacterized protein n=1 Tax=Ficus carica TaxID=3494 RepID=A0AA88J668_FICCA|nr:hypothetical protein TIFTF001_031979 [Ficus carica]GMN62947.1 hypothetical protein TIFTF001_032022 [Ficus carica]